MKVARQYKYIQVEKSKSSINASNKSCKKKVKYKGSGQAGVVVGLALAWTE